nr:unnamed protein product [Sorex araneus]
MGQGPSGQQGQRPPAQAPAGQGDTETSRPQPPALQDRHECARVSEAISRGMAHAAHKLQEYLGFEDPLSNLSPAPSTLNEIFLMHFISFCRKQNMDAWLTTTKMTAHQASLFGADWVWTFWGTDRQIRLQLAVQTLQLSSLAPASPGPDAEPHHHEGDRREEEEEEAVGRTRFDRLEKFCRLIGEDCLGLFLIFGAPGKPKDVRGVVLDSVRGGAPRGEAVARFVLETEACVPVRELLGRCLQGRGEMRQVGKAYIRL